MLVGFLKTANATVLWDVDRIRQDLQSGALDVTPRLMAVSDLVAQTTKIRNESAPCDMNDIPIAVAFPKNKFRLLWGDAQLHKAMRMCIRNTYCYLLSPEQHKQYIIAYDEAEYLRAIGEYWEGEWYDPYRDAEAFAETDE